MTIAFDVSYIQKQRTGYGRYSTELLQGLIENDHDNKYILHGWSYSLDMEKISTYKSDKICLNTTRIPGLIKRTYWNSIRTPKLESLIGEFDIFFGAEPLLPPTGKKTIATMHDLSYKRYPQFFEAGVRKWDPYVIRSMDQANAVIVPSNNTKNDLIELLHVPAEKIHIVYPPVGGNFSPQGSERDKALLREMGTPEQYILFTGTLEPRKNIPFLVKAFERFHRDHPEVYLLIAGKRGWLYDDILKSITHSAASKNIRHLDFVSEEMLQALYRSALFFVFPSIYEGWGSPVAEAMASGTPVITSKTSSLGEIGNNAAFLIDPTRADELTDAMRRLYSDENMRKELNRKGLERVIDFSRRNAAEKILGIYRLLKTR